jgi:hypothetical protein
MLLWDLPLGTVLERPYRHGGVMRWLPAWFLGSRRARREWHLHRQLYRQGFPTCEPIGYKTSPLFGPLYRLSLFTRWCPTALALPALVRSTGRCPASKELAALCAALLKRGVCHPDLNLNNFLFTEGRWLLIDFDGAHIGATPTIQQARRLLARLLRSAHKLGIWRHLSPWARLRFVQQLARELALPPADLLTGLNLRPPGPLSRLRWFLSGGHRQG